jgi:hypothetical protein
MKNWMKALMLSALLFSGSAIAQESDLQQELEDKNLFYWAQKPAQCSSADAVVDLMKRHGENPTVWMEGITGFPNGAFNKSKFVIAINHEANPITWSLIEFVDDGRQACILGFGQGAINLGNIPLKEKGIDL